MAKGTQPDWRIVRFAAVACGIAGVIVSGTLGTLRVLGLVSPERYPWLLIIGWPFAFLILLPGTLWVVQQPQATPWFERLGAVILFGFVPAMTVLILYRLLMQV